METLKNGHYFMKYGRKGSPHIRLIYLSEEEDKIYYVKEGVCCLRKVKFILTREIKDIYFGNSNNKIFQRFSLDKSEEENCFSIITSSRSLDLHHEDAKITKVWYRAMKKFCNRNGFIKEVKESYARDFTAKKEIVGQIWKEEILPEWRHYRVTVMDKKANILNTFALAFKERLLGFKQNE